MNNDENKYVTPTPVDTSGEVNSQDTMLGRERNNIINATNQVNSSVNQQQVIETNNRIKTEKKIPFIVKFLCMVIAILLMFFISFYVVKYAKKFINAGKIEETTTTVSPLAKSIEYWNKDTVRKYEGYGKTFIFLPRNISSQVYLIESNGTYITETALGTYDNDKMYMTMDDTYTYSVSNKGLLINDKEYSISTGEIKYYVSDDNNSILVVNAKPGALQGLFVSPNSSVAGVYDEDDNNIYLGEAKTTVFEKNGNTVTYNGITLTLQL